MLRLCRTEGMLSVHKSGETYTPVCVP
uniref:Uncharacterized protein n=1 Tax=Triticum urartu TaxID=4572 RepID=A0A8R7TTU0_TRIUA